jgi:hypothetical protein
MNQNFNSIDQLHEAPEDFGSALRKKFSASSTTKGDSFKIFCDHKWENKPTEEVFSSEFRDYYCKFDQTSYQERASTNIE